MTDDPFTPAGVARTLAAIRARAPLIHNITNAVVTNSTANALLAVGASPAMVEGAEEVAEFVARSAALVVNLGTMSAPRAAAMRLAAAAALRHGVPWVMDPVAVGFVAFRTAVARELLAFRPAAIRGNASEVMALAAVGAAGPEASGPQGSGPERSGPESGGKGVDSSAGSEAAVAAAVALAGSSGAAVAVTGAVDYATDGTRLVACRNGHPMMTRVTGLGCTATAIVGACLAVEPVPLVAVAHGLAIIGTAGELAAERARGPGSLQLELLDVLYAMDAPLLAGRARLEVRR